ncbi:MAG: type II toxin-antitoxin system Phd/YefM family antitoxin [bacterium]
MISVNTHEAKTRLSELLSKVEEQSKRVIICRNGEPVAEVIPWAKGQNPIKQDPGLRM